MMPRAPGSRANRTRTVGRKTTRDRTSRPSPRASARSRSARRPPSRRARPSHGGPPRRAQRAAPPVALARERGAPRDQRLAPGGGLGGVVPQPADDGGALRGVFADGILVFGQRAKGGDGAVAVSRRVSRREASLRPRRLRRGARVARLPKDARDAARSASAFAMRARVARSSEAWSAFAHTHSWRHVDAIASRSFAARSAAARASRSSSPSASPASFSAAAFAAASNAPLLLRAREFRFSLAAFALAFAVSASRAASASARRGANPPSPPPRPAPPAPPRAFSASRRAAPPRRRARAPPRARPGARARGVRHLPARRACASPLPRLSRETPSTRRAHPPAPPSPAPAPRASRRFPPSRVSARVSTRWWPHPARRSRRGTQGVYRAASGRRRGRRRPPQPPPKKKKRRRVRRAFGPRSRVSILNPRHLRLVRALVPVRVQGRGAPAVRARGGIIRIAGGRRAGVARRAGRGAGWGGTAGRAFLRHRTDRESRQLTENHAHPGHGCVCPRPPRSFGRRRGQARFRVSCPRAARPCTSRATRAPQ